MAMLNNQMVIVNMYQEGLLHCCTGSVVEKLGRKDAIGWSEKKPADFLGPSIEKVPGNQLDTSHK